MNSIIKDLYEGNLYPSGQSGSTMRRFCKEWRKAGQSYDRLKEKLDPEGNEALEMFMDMYSEFVGMELERSFSDGFILASKLMCEVFVRQDTDREGE